MNHTGGSGQRMCWETSALQLPSVTTIHSHHIGKGLAVPTKTQLMLDLNKMPLNPLFLILEKDRNICKVLRKRQVLPNLLTLR